MSAEADADEAPVYACQLRLGRPGVRLRLVPPRLEWTVGPQQGETMLADITRVRLTWRPGQLMKAAYHLELAARDGLRLEIGSVSRVSIAGVRDQGPAYAAFVRALHRALAASGGFSSEMDPASGEENATTRQSGADSRIIKSGTGPEYRAGFAPWRWRLMVALLAAAVAAALVMGWQLAGSAPMHVTLFVAFMLVAVTVPAVTSVIRNRPQSYPEGAPPERLLPQPE